VTGTVGPNRKAYVGGRNEVGGGRKKKKIERGTNSSERAWRGSFGRRGKRMKIRGGGENAPGQVQSEGQIERSGQAKTALARKDADDVLTMGGH